MTETKKLLVLNKDETDFIEKQIIESIQENLPSFQQFFISLFKRSRDLAFESKMYDAPGDVQTFFIE